jgi:lipoprotein-anchoring transpeptidase ErfK/SrfK
MRHTRGGALLVLLAGAAGAHAEPTLNAAQRSALALQVRLDRAHFSPGEIDAAAGTNTHGAWRAWMASRGGGGGEPNDGQPDVVEYTITAQDAAGPFVTVPEDMMDRAALPALGYTSLLEALAERFHASPALLRALNPGRPLRAGQRIVVPNVQRPPLPPAASVRIDGSDGALYALDAAGTPLARYPITAGSERDPLPVGRWTIMTKLERPAFFYNPDLFWDADESHSKARIAPGPNNPVGLVWIDISKEHYGIHGTPEPSTVGKTQSHGCIRLTNWDALELYALVSAGLPVVIQE